MDFFLKSKSWQVFILLVVLPFGVQGSVMSFLFSSEEIDPAIVFQVMPILMLVFMVVFIVWFWSLGVGINKRISKAIKPKVKLFKFCIIYSALYMVVFQVFFQLTASGQSPSGAIAFIFPLHLVGMFSMFYALYFVAKNIATFEQNKAVKFSDFSGPFFLLWFFPIGIWVIQPRINQIYANQEHNQQLQRTP